MFFVRVTLQQRLVVVAGEEVKLLQHEDDGLGGLLVAGAQAGQQELQVLGEGAKNLEKRKKLAFSQQGTRSYGGDFFRMQPRGGFV